MIGYVGLFLAAVAAGMVNSVAGGGTLIAFPSLVGFGETEIVSNATSTAALWPGALSSAFAYMKDTPIMTGLLALLIVPSVIGGLLGALILVNTPLSTFRLAVPFLILSATLLFASRNRFSQRFSKKGGEVTTSGRVGGFLFQLFVATYGGYFGAGIGILMLASLSMMGLRDIHVMNTIKTVLGALINVTAFFFFAYKGLVVWPLALLMAVGAILGGYIGARSAKRVNQKWLHITIVTIGLAVSLWFFTRIIQTL